jgi:4-hydroxyphenylacetate 3-monooxygenase
VTKGHSYRTYDWERAAALLERLLGSYRLDDELQSTASAAKRP